MNDLYVVHWRAKGSGAHHKGTHCYPKDVAQRLADELNKNYHHLVHWIELMEVSDGDGIECSICGEKYYCIHKGN